ncbi:hypothetical protein ACN38_g13064 [Penicillium nordicum]|uniref:Uncharacterized protein n=1 Tax=Penicillium nordicum TaxID=229535 RepID=A0A0M9W9B6_9EURO|nr:hypothetical protein ACN38_g13064 [Penicillium nordicum]
MEAPTLYIPRSLELPGESNSCRSGSAMRANSTVVVQPSGIDTIVVSESDRGPARVSVVRRGIALNGKCLNLLPECLVLA